MRRHSTLVDVEKCPLELASCLINAQPLPAQCPATTPLLAAQGHDLTEDWSLPSAHFIDS